jgi:hypothetical protein
MAAHDHDVGPQELVEKERPTAISRQSIASRTGLCFTRTCQQLSN